MVNRDVGFQTLCVLVWKITMTDQSVLRWLHEVLGVGTLNKKPRKGRRKDGTRYLMQYLMALYV